MFKPKPEARKALLLGSMCSVSYLAVYFVRNILSAVSPQMIGNGDFTTESIGTLSSVYFITYAFGQLINGSIGDKIKAKYMVSGGLLFAGICNAVFPLFTKSLFISYIAYAISGFALSMIYGPMVKVVAENTEPLYATRCSLGYTFASFFGSPIAGLVAAAVAWQGVFTAGSISLVLMGILCFTGFTVFEKRGLIKYNQYKTAKKNQGAIKTLINRGIIKFSLISIVTGIIRTTVVFWLPTYISQYLGFSAEKSSLIFTACTFFVSASAFIAIFCYERIFKYNIHSSTFGMFITSAVAFLGVFLIKQSAVNILLITLAIIFSNCAATLLFSVYCPSLRDTGFVSSATGYLDFISYMAASFSSTLFANSVNAIGWKGLILIWFGIMLFGVVISLPLRKLKGT